MAITHIHIGPSPLAHGLPLVITRTLPGTMVHMIGKPGDRGAKYYQRTAYHRDGSSSHDPNIPLASVTGPEGSDVPGAVRAAITDAELVLITVSLRDHIADRADLVKAIVAESKAVREIVFISCENARTPALRDLIRGLGPRVLCVESIVDRVCVWPDLSESPPTPRHVIHHEVGEWILRRPETDSELISLLAQVDEVSVVEDRLFRAYQDRKSWVVNGMHLDAAIRGRAHNQPDLRRVAEDPELHAAVQQTLEVMQEACLRRHELRISSDWATDRLRVVSQLPDSADRILRGLRRSDPVPFLAGLEKRIAEPARISAGIKPPPSMMQQLAEDLTSVLVDLEQYYDWHTLTAGALSEQRDEAAVLAFERTLTGWVKQSVISREADRLKRELRRHRRVLE